MTSTTTTAKKGAHIPDAVKESSLSRYLAAQGMERIYQGKTRDMYPLTLPGDTRGYLVLASNRVSVFDHVLPVYVPCKGEVLRGLTHFWLTGPLQDFPHHLRSFDARPELNAVHALSSQLPDLPFERCLVVRHVDIPPFEMIYRGHIGGSVYKDYQKTGVVAGQNLTKGMPKWARLDRMLFTPSTKEETGHDLNITVEEYLEGMGRWLGTADAQSKALESIELFRSAYQTAYDYARARGILMLDTKCEGFLELADELFTPDSSRFTTVGDLRDSLTKGRDPMFYDKQIVRDYCAELETPKGKGLKSLDPTDPADQAWIQQNVRIPQELLEETGKRYLAIFEMIVGVSLEEYQAKERELAAA